MREKLPLYYTSTDRQNNCINRILDTLWNHNRTQEKVPIDSHSPAEQHFPFYEAKNGFVNSLKRCSHLRTLLERWEKVKRRNNTANWDEVPLFNNECICAHIYNIYDDMMYKTAVIVIGMVERHHYIVLELWRVVQNIPKELHSFLNWKRITNPEFSGDIMERFILAIIKEDLR